MYKVKSRGNFFTRMKKKNRTLDFTGSVGAVFVSLDSVKNIVHWGPFLWAWPQEPAATYHMTQVITKRDLFGNQQSVERFLKPFGSRAVFFHL